MDRMLCPFKIGEMLGPFFTIVSLPVRDVNLPVNLPVMCEIVIFLNM
jgi:hypothetical protein